MVFVDGTTDGCSWMALLWLFVRVIWLVFVGGTELPPPTTVLFVHH